MRPPATAWILFEAMGFGLFRHLPDVFEGFARGVVLVGLDSAQGFTDDAEFVGDGARVGSDLCHSANLPNFVSHESSSVPFPSSPLTWPASGPLAR